jgi:hypothetical protein
MPIERAVPIFPGRVRQDTIPRIKAKNSMPQIKYGPLIQKKSRDDLKRIGIRNGIATAINASESDNFPIVNLFVSIFLYLIII